MQALMDNPDAGITDRNWKYVESDGGIPVRYKNPRYSPVQDWISGKGGDSGLEHFRSRLFHAVKKADGSWVVHKNQFPSTALGGLMMIPHVVLEGSIGDIIGKGSFSNFIDEIRWTGLKVGTEIYRYHYLY